MEISQCGDGNALSVEVWCHGEKNTLKLFKTDENQISVSSLDL